MSEWNKRYKFTEKSIKPIVCVAMYTNTCGQQIVYILMVTSHNNIVIEGHFDGTH